MRGHIRKRGKTWTTVLYLGRDPQTGKKKYKTKGGFKTKKEAEKYINEKINQIENNTYFEPQKMTVAEYLKSWIETYVKQNLAPLTQDSYIRDIEKHIIPAIGHYPLQKIHPLHIQQYYNDIQNNGRLDGKGGLSAKTALYHHRILTKAFSTAVKHRLISVNPAGQNVDTPKPKKHVVKTYDENDCINLLRILKGHKLEIPVNMALAGDLRRGEVLGAKWSKLDFENGTLLVDEQLVAVKGEMIFKGPKSNDGTRLIIFPPAVLEMLDKHRKRQIKQKLCLGTAYQDNDLINCYEDGRPINPGRFSHWFSDFIKEKELPPITFHGLRHTGISVNLNSGVPINIVSKNAGHSTSSFTMDVYGHLMKAGQKLVALSKQKVIYDKINSF